MVSVASLALFSSIVLGNRTKILGMGIEKYKEIVYKVGIFLQTKTDTLNGIC